MSYDDWAQGIVRQVQYIKAQRRMRTVDQIEAEAAFIQSVAWIDSMSNAMRLGMERCERARLERQRVQATSKILLPPGVYRG
jgi:hypothetical protein